MRLTLETHVPLPVSSAQGTAPPVTLIQGEPFILELQGALAVDTSDGEHGGVGGGDDEEHLQDGRQIAQTSRAGVQIGKLDLSEPTRPILQVAHHRLEGKLVTLHEPLALIKRVKPLSKRDDGERASKRARLEDHSAGASDDVGPASRNRLEISAIITRKIVFSKRPEPLVTLSSEADF